MGAFVFCGLTEAGGATSSEPGAGPEPDEPPGAVGETGVSGACGTVLGFDGLNVGGGGGGGLITGGGGAALGRCAWAWAWAWPTAKAAIIAARETAAKHAAAERSNPVAAIPVSFSFVCNPNAPLHQKEIWASSSPGNPGGVAAYCAPDRDDRDK